MFYDLSFKKISAMTLLCVALGGGILGTLSLGRALGPDFIANRLIDARVAMSAVAYRAEYEGSANAAMLARVYSLFRDIGGTEKASAEERAQSIPVLVYHGIVNDADVENITLTDFKEQLFALRRAGWQTVTLADFSRFIKSEIVLPEKSFLLTFDDGRKDSYYPADPLLKALGYNAVVFAISRHITDETHPYYLSQKELLHMLDSGRWEVGAHTKDGHDMTRIAAGDAGGHFYSDKLWLDGAHRLETTEEFIARVSEDFAAARRDIESALGTTILGFAFPFGDFGQDSKNFPEAKAIVPGIARDSYPLLFYQVRSNTGFSFNYPQNGNAMMKRFEVGPEWTPETLLAALDAGKEKTLPYADTFEQGAPGWIRTWGSMHTQGGVLALGAQTDTTGSTAFLDGSRSWKEYSFQAVLDWLSGNNVVLMARYHDEANHLACNFTDDTVRIERYTDGTFALLREAERPSAVSTHDLPLEIRVEGNTIECVVGGYAVSYTDDESSVIHRGGIGFKTWDPQAGNSAIAVKEIFVGEIP